MFPSFKEMGAAGGCLAFIECSGSHFSTAVVLDAGQHRNACLKINDNTLKDVV